MTIAIEQASGATENTRSSLPPRLQRTAKRACPQACLRYCLLLILAPLLAIPAGIALGRSDFFLHHGASVWVQANDQVFAAAGRDCDVLVFGDSTAMTGIDPDRVQQQTGYKTCNIAVTNAVLAVTGDLTLDHFLAHNPHPRVLLVQLSPDGFQPENHVWQQTIYAEGLLELLRHGRPGEARHVLLSHPQEAVAFAGYAVGYTAWYGIKQALFLTTHLRPQEDTVTVHNGFFTIPAPPRTTCEPASRILDHATPERIAFSRKLVAEYQRTYANRADVVLVNVAPIPDCDQNLAAYAAQLDGVTSNLLLPMNIGYFNNCCHYTPRGSEIVSSLIANELNTVASQYPDLTKPAPTAPTVATLRRIGLTTVHQSSGPRP